MTEKQADEKLSEIQKQIDSWGDVALNIQVAVPFGDAGKTANLTITRCSDFPRLKRMMKISMMKSEALKEASQEALQEIIFEKLRKDIPEMISAVERMMRPVDPKEMDVDMLARMMRKGEA